MVGRVEVRKICVQVNFLGEAEDGEARVNMEEHSVAVWVYETDVEGLEILSRFLRFEMSPERDEVLWRPDFVPAETANLLNCKEWISSKAGYLS